MTIQKKRRIILTIFSVCIAVLCAFASVLNPVIYRGLIKCNVVGVKNSLVVHFVSVGQGDAIAINLPDGKTMIIDAGVRESSVSFTNYIDDFVLSGFRDNMIDYVVFTHSDNDHVGGGLRLLQRYDIGTIFIPTIYDDSSDYSEIRDYIKDNSCRTVPHQDGFVIADNGYKIEFFGPVGLESTNDSSPMIKISYRGYSFLFTGDISSEAEQVFVDKYSEELDCDILKVAHHGSKYSTSLEFVQAVTPKVSIISCGKNEYGHPTDIVIDRLVEQGSDILRTDTDGNIAVVVNDYGLYSVSGEYMLTRAYDYWVYLLIVWSLVISLVVLALFREWMTQKKQKLNES